LIEYGGNKEILPQKEILELYKNKMLSNLDVESYSPKKILLVNAMLMMEGKQIKTLQYLVDECFEDIKSGKYKRCTAFYSSNCKTDIQPGNGLPNTYFGSPAITCSLYIEFLNLYKLRFFGSHFS
jgi:hypothetical protein